MSLFIESIALINNTLKNIELHNLRLNMTRDFFFNQTNFISLEKIIEPQKELQKDTLYKCRIVYSQNIEEITYTEYKIKQINSLQIIQDNNINYSYKFKDRTPLNRHLEKNKCDEIIFIKHGFVTDTSYSNLIFFDGKQWFTPKTYLLNGIQRQYLLKNNIILEKQIKVSDIHSFSHFKLINSLLTIENSPLLSTSIIQ